MDVQPVTNVDWDLLGRYAADECTAEERAQVARRLEAEPAYAAALAAITRVTPQARDIISAERRDALFAVLESRVGVAAPPPRPWWIPAMKIAAAVLLAVGLSVAGYGVLYSPPGAGRPAESEFRTISTARGQRLALRLPDSTHVVLGPVTTLRFASTYGASDRAVELVGQAAFSVVHDDRRPFTVRAGELVATDLGTEFVVRAYPGDGQAEVVVREGIVDIQATTERAGDGRRVHAGQRGRLSAAGVPIVEPADVAADFAWTEGRLFFGRTTLGATLPQLERWYDVEIHLAPAELAAVGFTGWFLADQPTAEMLDAVAAVLHLDVVRTGPRSYTLSRRSR